MINIQFRELEILFNDKHLITFILFCIENGIHGLKIRNILSIG